MVKSETKHSLKFLKQEIKYIKKIISKDNDLYKKVVKLEYKYDQIKILDIPQKK